MYFTHALMFILSLTLTRLFAESLWVHLLEQAVRSVPMNAIYLITMRVPGSNHSLPLLLILLALYLLPIHASAGSTTTPRTPPMFVDVEQAELVDRALGGKTSRTTLGRAPSMIRHASARTNLRHACICSNNPTVCP